MARINGILMTMSKIVDREKEAYITCALNPGRQTGEPFAYLHIGSILIHLDTSLLREIRDKIDRFLASDDGKRAAVCEPVKGPAPAGAEGKVAGPTRWAYHADHGIITTADGHTLIAEGVAAKDGPLLAAAPDLLEALAELLDDAHREGYSTGPVIRKAAAAIARAEGPG